MNKLISVFTRRSLLQRFFLASLVILPLFIILSGTLLLNTFHHSQLNAEEEKLQAQLYLLLSVTEVENNGPLLPDALTEPRLNQQASGLYAFITDGQNTLLWRSSSSELLPVSLLPQDNTFRLNQRFFTQVMFENPKSLLNVLSYDTEWVNSNDDLKRLRFIIVSDAATLIAELNSYRSRLWQWLGLMGIALILAQMFIMRWGLQPLKTLSAQLTKVQNNSATQLSDDYPIEIQPVIDDFNNILLSEKQQRERYRNTLSDLAHSLKTPLAVIQSQLSTSVQHDPIISDQVDRIDQIISHQLRRAAIRINQSPINHNTDKISVHTMVERLINIMTKVYPSITIANLSSTTSHFYGDEADLLEVLGNIIDNACKHGNTAVVIDTYSALNNLTIRISDDGNGVAHNQQHTILQRGTRADTAKPGQGIGLSIAVDIISSYGGEIIVSNNVGRPHLPGACFCVRFDC
ncbi:MAG: two-component system sensor histidine kinase PhoQ [Candidatus Endobugula sp.]|jgi:two-component system sensor histidine kinase PhoQ